MIVLSGGMHKMEIEKGVAKLCERYKQSLS